MTDEEPAYLIGTANLASILSHGQDCGWFSLGGTLKEGGDISPDILPPGFMSVSWPQEGITQVVYNDSGKPYDLRANARGDDGRQKNHP